MTQTSLAPRAPTAESGAHSSQDAPVALVTGGAQRIGRAIALALADAGWRVAVHYRHSSAEAAALVEELASRPATPGTGAGGSDSTLARARAFGADLADEAQCRALVPEVVRTMGRIDAVINNASLFEHDSAADFSFATMERHWRANTGAPVLLAQALHAAGGRGDGAPTAGGRGDGAPTAGGRGDSAPTAGGRGDSAHAAATRVVVNLLDQKLWNLNPDHLSYTLSKAALEAATRMLAMALAPRTRVCGVAPGITLTSSEMSAAEFAAAHRMTPLQRGASAEDIARAVRFLVESPAITGTTLLVDGGQHLSAQPRDVVFLARSAVPDR